MLNRIIKFSLQNRIIVLVAAVLLMLAGLHTARTMDVDVFPDLNAPTVAVMTEAQGMAPEEVEQLVTFPIETAVNGATDVRRVRSSSTTGFSIVWVEFDWGTDIYRARQVVSEKISALGDQLPPGVGAPTLGPQSSILGELMFIALTTDGSTNMRDLRTLADWAIRPRLLATGGVAQVAVLGGDIKEYQALVDPARLKHYGIALNEVVSAVQDMNQNTTGGILYEYGNEYIVRGMLSTHDAEAMGKAVVKRIGQTPVTLADIAEVKVGDSAPKMGTASLKGQPCVMMTVTKQPNVSTLELTERLDTALADVGKSLPPGVKVTTDVYRQERFINSSIDNVRKSLLEGGVFVVIVLFIFLMNVRTTLISLVTIPLSLVVSLLTLHLMGLTINTMSLGGMAIAIGSLVDDAIVDVENVYKRLREKRMELQQHAQNPPQNQQNPKQNQQNPKQDAQAPRLTRQQILQTVFQASREVRMPILNSTLIIIVSFVPLFFLSGMEGRLLAPLGIAFITALCASTVVALTLTPVLCSYLLGGSQRVREPWVSRWIQGHYRRSLQWTLRHRRTVLAATTALLLAAIGIFTQQGRSFLPPFNEGSFTINVSTMPGISLEESDRVGIEVEKLLLGVPEIQTVGRKTGRAELDEHALGVNTSEIEAPFVLKDRSKDEVIADIRRRLATVPGVSVEVGAPITHRIDAMLSGTQANIAIKIFGEDLTRLYAIGQEIRQKIAGVEGIADLNVEQQVERPQLQIIPRRDMLAKYGITLAEFSETVNVLLAGQTVSTVFEGNRSFNLVLKADTDKRATAEGVGNLLIDAGGQKIPLSFVADIVSATGPNTINRENVSRKLVVSANVAGRDLNGVVGDIQRTIAEETVLPEGYHIEYGGQFESEQAASRTLLVASFFSILVIFLLLFNQFRHVLQSVAVLLNLPLALIGGILAISLSGGIISIPAIIGFISLFGIATRNGMLLIARYNDLRAQGYGTMECVVRGSADRLNPILMTALSSALALVPLAMGGELPGNEIQSPMAKVILGGLFTSTLLNAFVIPVMYTLIHRKNIHKNDSVCNGQSAS